MLFLFCVCARNTLYFPYFLPKDRLTHKYTPLRWTRNQEFMYSCVQSCDWWGLTGGLVGWGSSQMWFREERQKKKKNKKERKWKDLRRASVEFLLCICVWICMCACCRKWDYSITFLVNKYWSSSDGPCLRPPACPFPDPFPDTHLGKVEFELLSVELGLMQLDASAGSCLWGAEVDPDSPEAFEHLESRLFIVDPKQRLEPLLWRIKTEQSTEVIRDGSEAVGVSCRECWYFENTGGDNVHYLFWIKHISKGASRHSMFQLGLQLTLYPKRKQWKYLLQFPRDSPKPKDTQYVHRYKTE